MKIRTQSQKIGTIPLTNKYSPNDTILFSGSVWKVIEVDEKNLQLLVKKGKEGKTPLFEGVAIPTAFEVHQKMQMVLMSDMSYEYLDPRSLEQLKHSRLNFKNLLKDPCYIPVFFGSKVTNTLAYFVVQASTPS